jgi:hypothetical protein
MSARLPDFIAIGPPRTGTTWLHGVLYHRACLPEGVKETRFFDLFYDRGLDWYLGHFQGCAEDRPVGEISPTYFRWNTARERIFRDLGSCKIICTLREPVSRAYSQYRQLHTLGMARGSFETELMSNDKLFEFTRYGFHLRAWYERFGPERVGVFLYDDLKADEQGFVDDVCRFIGVPPLPLTPEISRFLDRNEVTRGSRNQLLAYNGRRLMYWLQQHHAYRLSQGLERLGLWRYCFGRGESFPALDATVEARLRKRLLPEVEAVERLIGRDLSAWKLPSSGRGEERAAASI